MHIAILTLLIISIICAITIKDLLKASIALGAASVILAIIFFGFNSPYAAAFELSICSGLITVLFISAISMLKEEE